MLERDIQQYLYDNPGVLFPGKEICEKSKEYYIKGKRIDLLFLVEGTRYIVEIKNKAISREHIGQIIEYYGLMKSYLCESNLKMILVTTSFPDFMKTYLEELGIKCVQLCDTTLESSNFINAKRPSSEAKRQRNSTAPAANNTVNTLFIRDHVNFLKKHGYIARQNGKSNSFHLNITGPGTNFNDESFKGIVILSNRESAIIIHDRASSLTLRDNICVSNASAHTLKKEIYQPKEHYINVIVNQSPDGQIFLQYQTKDKQNKHINFCGNTKTIKVNNHIGPLDAATLLKAITSQNKQL